MGLCQEICNNCFFSKECLNTNWDLKFTLKYIFVSILNCILCIIAIPLGLIVFPIGLVYIEFNFIIPLFDNTENKNCCFNIIYNGFIAIITFLIGLSICGFLIALFTCLFALSFVIFWLNPFFLTWYFLAFPRFYDED